MKDISVQLSEWNKKAWEINRSSPKEAIQFATQALSASKITRNERERAISRFIIGTSQVWLSEYEESIKNIHEAKIYFEKNNEIDYNAKCAYSLGTWYYYLSDYEESLNHFIESLNLYKEANNIIGQADAKNGIGSVYYEIGNYEDSLSVLKKSFELLKDQSAEHIKAKVLHGLGKASYHSKEYPQAEKYFLDCLKICNNNGYLQEIVFANEGLSNLYLAQNLNEKLNKHLNIAIKVARDLEFKIGLARILFLKGKSLLNTNEKEAFEVFYEAIEIADQIDNLDIRAGFHQTLGQFYEDQKNFELTVFHLKKHQEYREKINDKKHGLHLKGLNIKINLERVEKENEIYKIKNKELNYRSEYLKESNDRIRTIGELGQEIASKLDLEELLTLIYSQVNKLMSADVMYVGTYNEVKEQIEFPFYMKKLERIHDVIVPMSHRGKFTVWCIKNQKQMILNDVDKEASEYISLIDNDEKENPPSSIMILPIKIKDKLIGVIGVHSYTKDSYTSEKVDILKTLGAYVSIAIENSKIYSTLSDANELIERKNDEILDSINYAKRLQDAILPNEENIKRWFPNSFIFYQPKDIVSGDFYWTENIDGIKYIAAADCTGHGVPGAMVSMVCSNALNRAIKEFNLRSPSDILDKTRELVTEAFAKSGKFVHDGMDIALCSIKGKLLCYSGANNPLWIIRKTIEDTSHLKFDRNTTVDNISLFEFKADKQNVGYTDVNDIKPFTQKEIKLETGDRIYIFSDGFADQFGGENDKKLKSKPFKNLLIRLTVDPIKRQDKQLSTIFNNWKAEQEQIDDVCVIGIEI
ncbi:MAG: tetratricopeptide repeat protein [Flavobacteriales bacterium]|nr:tetratricopeptide repeat protein [Flavobacteriales bacterium]